MLYLLFLVIAIVYNIRKFRKERTAFLSSLVEAKNSSHREMILGHFFYVFIFEGFLAVIVAHLVSERAMSIGMLGLGGIYLCLLFLGFYLFQFFIRYLEKHTQLELYQSFKNHLIKELRVNFSLIMLPILVYALINWAFQDSVYQEWGSLWFIGMILNIIFVSVLTIVCSVIIMLRLIPNREITEPEYLQLINRRLTQIGQPNMRIRWIETDVKNAFVVGLKLLKFSNQTMFIGRSLRTSLTMEEFDSVICHELGHVANRHIHKRVIDLMKNFLSIIFGTCFILIAVIGFSFLYWGEDAYVHSGSTTLMGVILCISWFFFNYSLLFDTIRSHEYESDAYAVMVLGANISAFKSALEKLSTPEELPEYLQKISRKPSHKGFVHRWLLKKISTHPDLADRMFLLEHKISAGLPFNHYVSTAQKVKKLLGHLVDWKISVPLSVTLVMAIGWSGFVIKRGTEDINFIANATPEEIVRNKELLTKLNGRPQLIGNTLMYFIVKRRDEKLIDHFVDRGADKGKTLVYISELKDARLFNNYYSRFQQTLTEDEYFLVLRKTAQVNFTEGYRVLVNSKKFETLEPSYKEDVARLQETYNERRPASLPEKD